MPLDDPFRPLDARPAPDPQPWPAELRDRLAVLERKANLALVLLALVAAGVLALLVR